MVERTLRLTWHRAVAMAAIYAGLLFAHAAIDAVFHVHEQLLFLGATLVVPMWAISTAVYTFDNLMFDRGQRRRLPM